jgi:hypothetical protein
MKAVLSFSDPELASGPILETAQQVTRWMLKQVQHDGAANA